MMLKFKLVATKVNELPKIGIVPYTTIAEPDSVLGLWCGSKGIEDCFIIAESQEQAVDWVNYLNTDNTWMIGHPVSSSIIEYVDHRDSSKLKVVKGSEGTQYFDKNGKNPPNVYMVYESSLTGTSIVGYYAYYEEAEKVQKDLNDCGEGGWLIGVSHRDINGLYIWDYVVDDSGDHISFDDIQEDD